MKKKKILEALRSQGLGIVECLVTFLGWKILESGVAILCGASTDRDLVWRLVIFHWWEMNGVLQTFNFQNYINTYMWKLSAKGYYWHLKTSLLFTTPIFCMVIDM